MSRSYTAEELAVSATAIEAEKAEHRRLRGVATSEDRSIAVPAGFVVVTGYVRMERVRMACRERMAVGDIDRAYQRTLQLGADQRWPCPMGEWEADPEDGARQFALLDGRHEYVASLMLGRSHLLVAWLEPFASQRLSPP